MNHNNFKFNFSLLYISCSCGNYFKNTTWLSNFLKIMIDSKKDKQKIAVSWKCPRCHKIKIIDLLVVKNHNMFFVKKLKENL